LCLADLILAGKAMIIFRPFEEVTGEGAAAASWLEANPGIFRVYSPSYSLPQQTASSAGLQLADGVDPLQLVSYVTYMERATGVPIHGYSVTMPPFESGEPSTANIEYHPSPDLLGELNVRFIVASFDIPDKDLVLKERFGDTRVYENMKTMPRAWVQSKDSFPGNDVRPVQTFQWEPNRITAQVDGPGLFVLSELAYPGWQVLVDGKREDIVPVGGLLRGVSLESGTHQVAFVFYPSSLYLGLLFCSMGIGSIFWTSRATRLG
jgi:hypothetical protein